MNATWGLLAVLSVVCHTESRCSPTSYYKNCWIRRFPGLFIDVEESQRRGAQLLEHYQEETALKCSRACCLTRNFSCNLAVFHYDSSQEKVNCFHLHCPTLESCILSHRGNVILYNITKGVDPDLLVFGKYFTSNVRVLPHYYGRVNASEPLPSDKRQFIHPPPPAGQPPTAAPSGKSSSTVHGAHAHTATAGPDGSRRSATTPAKNPEAPPTAPPSPGSVTSAGPHSAHPPPASVTSTVPPSTSTSSPLDVTTLPQLAASPPSFTTSVRSVEVSEQSSHDAKGGLGGGQTEAPEDGAAGEAGPGWHVAANTVLVAVAILITLLLSCVCSVLLLVSWRGQRKRVGRYRTTWRGRRGSMRLIKYVLVKESP